MDQATTEKMENILFTTTSPNSSVHRCAFAIDQTHAVTYLHGHHSSLELKDRVVLYGVMDPSLEIETTVRYVSKNYDVLILESTSNFPFFPSHTSTLYRGKEYYQLGVSQQREPTWRRGIISDTKKGWYVGSSHGRTGDSGAAILDSNARLLGVAIGKKNFSFLDTVRMPISEVADHVIDTRMVSIESVFAIADIFDKDEPPAKRPHVE